MANDPHNPARTNETWNLERIRLQDEVIRAYGDILTISGGWAWHFMSPKGHTEYKTQHDHKDVDVFVDPNRFHEFLAKARTLDFEHVKTLHDDPSGIFRRYTKFLDSGKLVFDVYFKVVPFKEAGGMRVVDPPYLLKLYESTHTSKECWAVKAAAKLVAAGHSPIEHPSLVR